MISLTSLHVGHPRPKVTWFKDGQSLTVGDPYEMSPDGVFLWVPQANLSSAGHYSCIATNAVGEKTKHTQLSVLREYWASPGQSGFAAGTSKFPQPLSSLLPLQV